MHLLDEDLQTVVEHRGLHRVFIIPAGVTRLGRLTSRIYLKVAVFFPIICSEEFLPMTPHSRHAGRKTFWIPAVIVLASMVSTHALAQRRNRDDQRDGYDRRSDAPPNAHSVVVPANVAWTNTRIQVSKGQWLRFQPSGEVKLSFNNDDVAVAAGAKSGRMADKAPIPSIYVGALIGRVNNSKPFSIGNTTQAFQMPANGTLFLGVNDDYPGDNSGNLVVKVWEP